MSDPLDPPSKWISVKDKLPGEHIFVLVAIDTDPSDPEAWDLEVAWLDGGEWRDVAGLTELAPDYDSERRATHWQPLPEPPEK